MSKGQPIRGALSSGYTLTRRLPPPVGSARPITWAAIRVQELWMSGRVERGSVTVPTEMSSAGWEAPHATGRIAALTRGVFQHAPNASGSLPPAYEPRRRPL